MKISGTVVAAAAALEEKTRNRLPIPIPLAGGESRKITKENALELKLWSTPDAENSPTYTEKVPLLDGMETPTQVLEWELH